MASSNTTYTNFYSRNDIVKHTFLTHGKSLLIDALRELFRGDSTYCYRQDPYGFPLIPDHTELPLEEGNTEIDADGNPIIETSTDLSWSSKLSTKILIGNPFKQDVKFYPVIIVRQTSGRNKPISFNQNAIQVHYRKEYVRDGYGNQILVRTPTHYVFGDAWEQSFEIRIVAEDLGDRDAIADIVSIGLMHNKRDELRQAGLFIKDMSTGGEQEEESLKHVSKTLYTYTITVNTYSEWSREVPVRNVIERINFYFDVARTGLRPSGVDEVLDNVVPDEAILIASIP